MNKKRSYILITLLMLGSYSYSADDGFVDAESLKGSYITEHGSIDLPHLLFGEVLYHYYQNSPFVSLNHLLSAKDKKVFTDNDQHSQILLGELYTKYGMPEQAEVVFDQLMNMDLLAKTLNETWLHKATLQYRSGNYDYAEKILTQSISYLTEERENERLIMLANIKMSKEKFSEAQELLSKVPLGSFMGAYAAYNLGAAMIRDGDLKEGIKVLEGVMNLPPVSSEILALKDRAALAIGFTWIQHEEYDMAQDTLIHIRLDGPFTNQALLGLGYANYSKLEYEKALPLWIDLTQRNPSDNSVQEALMLAPRAYEELGALPQALFSYRFAAKTFRDQLKNVEQTIIHLKQGNWLETLTPTEASSHFEDDPMAPITNFMPAHTPEAVYLYHLFASHDFVESYKQYLQLKRTENLVESWIHELPIFRETYAIHMKEIPQQLAKIRNVKRLAQPRYQSLQKRFTKIRNRVEDSFFRNNPVETATLYQLNLYEKVNSAKARLDRLPKTKLYHNIRERHRRVNGLLLWDMTFSAPVQRSIAESDVSKMEFHLAEATVKMSELGNLEGVLKNRQEQKLDVQIDTLESQALALKQRVKDAIDRQQILLENKALKVLAANRINLSLQLAEAHLSVARLQDASISSTVEKRAK